VEAATEPVASASELELPVAEEPVREEVEVVMEAVLLLWWVAEEAAAEVPVVALESVAEAVEDSVSLAELELSVAEAEAEEDESLALGAALLVLVSSASSTISRA
jgi:hypothetical protein